MDLMAFMETMGTSNIPVIAGFFIGLMMTLSPCTLTTNITAIAYISRRIDNSTHTLKVGFLYTLGRVITYIALSMLLGIVGINTQRTALILQSYGKDLLGPALILIGLVLLGKINPRIPGSRTVQQKGISVAQKGFFGAFLLGALFSLSFCPFSAVLFFGMLLPIAIKTGDVVFVPASFGFATGLPVIVVSALLAGGISKTGRALGKIQKFENISRKVFSGIFIIIGAYLSISTFI